MAVTHSRDLDEARARLGEWLASRAGAPVEIGEIASPATTGYSHETLLFDARWDGAARPLVCRLEPTGHTVFPDPDFAAEYRVIEALARTGVPVPSPVGFEPDRAALGSAFYVVSRVDGRAVDDNPPYTFGGWLHDASAAEQEAVWWAGIDALTRVHGVDPAPFAFLPRLEPVDWLARYLAWVIDGEPPPTIAAGLAWLRAHAPSEPGRKGLVWGDARPGNQMFRDGACVAVLDWELACIGDQDLDVGWWLYFDRLFSEGLHRARPTGFPSREDTIARYESLTGRAVRNLDWYEVYASFLFAVVLVRVTQLLAGTGAVELSPANERENFAIAFLGQILDEAGARA